MNATAMMISNGMEANLVKNPTRTNDPQIISKEPVKYAQKAGLLIPIFANRPAPTSSGRIYFYNPSERKINPTTSRGMSMEVADVFNSLFIKSRLFK
jgi:hypothetical protein